MKELIKICIFACTLSICLTGNAQATIIISTSETETLGNIKFEDGSLLEYDIATNKSRMILDEGEVFTGIADIDAACILNNGHIILSTVSTATIGDLTFDDGDLVEYDPDTQTAVLFFNEDLFGDNENIDAVSVLGNGHIILSTYDSAKLGGTLLDGGDLVEYDPLTEVGTLFFNQDEHFSSVLPNIDAIHVLDNDNIILSTHSNATLGGISFGKADLIKYNLPTKTAEVLLLGSEKFAEYNILTNVDALYIPEPTTIALFGIGTLILLRKHRY